MPEDDTPPQIAGRFCPMIADACVAPDCVMWRHGACLELRARGALVGTERRLAAIEARLATLDRERQERGQWRSRRRVCDYPTEAQIAAGLDP